MVRYISFTQGITTEFPGYFRHLGAKKQKDEEELYRPTPIPVIKSKNKVADWNSITGSMSSLSAASHLTSDVYLSNNRLPNVDYINPPQNYHSGRETLSIPRPKLSPPPPYDSTVGSNNRNYKAPRHYLDRQVQYAWQEENTGGDGGSGTDGK